MTNTPTWIAGRYGQALNFNGTSSYVNIADHADFYADPDPELYLERLGTQYQFQPMEYGIQPDTGCEYVLLHLCNSSTDAEAGPRPTVCPCTGTTAPNGRAQ